MRNFAVTYPQLMNQALAREFPETDLERLRKAYDLAAKYSEGLYRAQGDPFLSHLVRTASIVLAEGLPAETAVAALLHATYLFTSASCERLEEIVKALGQETEVLISGYNQFPWRAEGAQEEHLKNLPEYSPEKRKILLVRLANELEDHLDLAMIYRGNFPARDWIRSRGQTVLELARQAGSGALAQDLQEAYQTTLEKEIPERLKRASRDVYESAEHIRLRKGFWGRLTDRLKKTFFPRPLGPRPQPRTPFLELKDWTFDRELVGAVKACAQAQKNAAQEHLKNWQALPSEALHHVSPEALNEILSSGASVNGIRTEREISNVIVFNDQRYPDGVFSEEAAQIRKKVNGLVLRKVKDLFKEEELEVQSSGFFLYPPGGYMGWHTNWKNPGWRLYLSFTEEPGKSFFRYRDPATKEVVTSRDEELHVRCFKADLQTPFWHTIYSQTYRYSLGYKISKTPGLLRRLKRRIFKLLLQK